MCVGEWVDRWVGGGVWVRATLGHLAGPVICKSHELAKSSQITPAIRV